MLIGSRALPVLRAIRVKFILILILASLLALAGAYPTSAVLAAPPQYPTTFVYELYVSHPKATVCVGGTYPFPVEVRGHTEVKTYEGEYLGSPMSGGVGTTIRGSVSDPNVGTLTPSAIQTHMDVNYGGAGQANFTFHASKAGTTILNFKADVDNLLLENSAQITVEDCPYDVTMIAFTVAVSGEVKIWTTGQMSTRLNPAAGKLQGSGSVGIRSAFGGPVCSIGYTISRAPATLTAPAVENDQLKLSLSFGPASLANQVSCPGGGGSASHQIDLNKLHIPESIFPAEGGTVAYPLKMEGSDAGITHVFITAVPDWR
jgi:hypothetical protein